MTEKKLKIGKSLDLKIPCEDFKRKESTMIIKGFYLGKKYFYRDGNDEIIDPEFEEEESVGKKIFDLFAYKDNNHQINIAYKISNLEISPKKRLDVKSFPIELFHSFFEIKYVNEYLKERIENWKNKQNLIRKIGEN